MSISMSPNAKETFEFDRPVRSIEVLNGKILVTTPHVETPDEDTPAVASVLVDSSDIYDGRDLLGLIVHDLTGSRITITYSDEDDEGTP